MRLIAAVALALGLLLGAACAKEQDVVVKTGSGKELRAEDLDRDPVALLPAGAVGFAYFDAQQLFASEFGSKLLTLARARAPIPPSAGFEPGRDLQRMYVGFYSMQGADVAAVLTGRFDKDAIERSAERSDQTPLGAPIVKTRYAGQTLYTSRNVGFAVLTARTVVAGNETGIRRALDRIEAGRIGRELPAYMKGLLDDPKAPIIVGGDMKATPVADAAREQFKFLNGLQNFRALGNFQPPGVNVAATLGYETEEQARQGAENLLVLQQTLQSYGFIMNLLGIAQPIRQLDARAKGKDAYAVIGIEGQVLAQLLDQLAAFLTSALPAATSKSP